MSSYAQIHMFTNVRVPGKGSQLGQGVRISRAGDSTLALFVETLSWRCTRDSQVFENHDPIKEKSRLGRRCASSGSEVCTELLRAHIKPFEG